MTIIKGGHLLCFLFVLLIVVERSASFVVPSAQARTSIASTPLLPPSHRRSIDGFRLYQKQRPTVDNDDDKEEKEELSIVDSSRRRATLLGIATTVFSFAKSKPAMAATSDDCGLEDLILGNAEWSSKRSARQQTDASSSNDVLLVSPNFSTYAARFLLHFDDGARSWWNNQVLKSYSLLSDKDASDRIQSDFSSFAKSVQLALSEYVSSTTTTKSYDPLWNLWMESYGSTLEAKRQIQLLFALLEPQHQPTKLMMMNDSNNNQPAQEEGTSSNSKNSETVNNNKSDDWTALLPHTYQAVMTKTAEGNTQAAFTIQPSPSILSPLYVTPTATPDAAAATTTKLLQHTFAGPLASMPLKRERPKYDWSIYSLLGISGAVGCALTHVTVIPLDVVKTRAQTDAVIAGKSLFDSAASIVQREGLSGLLLGAQATVAGYLWYGISVYPSYTFFKRSLLQGLSTEWGLAHTHGIALVAGALAAVVASLGLTPLEAARIKVCADPRTYRPMGLIKTLQSIASQNALYAGLPSLLTRQVIFGSIKFLAFEQFCWLIYHYWPALQDETWTSLVVSLVAGGLAGCLSSILSQPADSILTYVAASTGGSGMGILQGATQMMKEEGPASLFRGLKSRCIWAGSIIAGQFFLYDIFRTWFGVSQDDLSQVLQVTIGKFSE